MGKVLLISFRSFHAMLCLISAWPVTHPPLNRPPPQTQAYLAYISPLNRRNYNQGKDTIWETHRPISWLPFSELKLPFWRKLFPGHSPEIDCWCFDLDFGNFKKLSDTAIPLNSEDECVGPPEIFSFNEKRQIMGNLLLTSTTGLFLAALGDGATP